MATDWLQYANQNATRRLPLSSQLVQAMGFLPELGVSMEVFSGGQPEKGSGLARVGSVRHDHGNAADVFFSKDGRRLDWANTDDRSVFQEIVKRAKAAGVTGFGAGPGYMQPGSMHIGFGSPGVWGAGGKGVTAPDWLSAAYNGTPLRTMAAAKAGAADPVGEVLSAGGSQPILGSMSTTAGQTPLPASSEAIPASVQAAAKPTSGGGISDILGMMAMAQSQGPQFSPVQIMGPTGDQANGLLKLVQALKGGAA